MYQRIRRIAAVSHLQMRYLMSRPYTVFRIVVFPFTEVLVYALITRYLLAGSTNVGEGAFVVIGSMAWILISEFQRGFTLAFFDLIFEHTLPAVWTTPMRLWEWFVGVALTALAITGATGVVIVATAAAFGVPVGGLGWWVVPTFVIGGILAFALALLVIVCVLRWGYGAAELAWGIGAMLSPVSGAFVPVAALPPVLQPIAQVLPTTMLFTAMRAAWSGGEPWPAFAIAFAAALGSLCVMLIVMQRALARFRRRVSVTRFV